MSPHGILQKENCFKIKNIILIASGKGGVGKSTMASALAFYLSKLGCNVGLLDADIYGPSIPTIWNIDSTIKIKSLFYKNTNMLVPIDKYNIKLMSIGFFTKKNDAMILRGPMITSTINQMLTNVLWGNLDYLILDLPPGTGDIQISLMQKFPISTSIIITTMQNICFADVLRTKNMLEKMNISILGCIINMSFFQCDKCLKHHDLFSNPEGELLIQSLNIPILTKIPIDTFINQVINSGKVINFIDNSIINYRLLNLSYDIATKIAKKAHNIKKMLDNQLPII